jgi:hypothetical protein
MPQQVTKETLEAALATQAYLHFEHKFLRNTDGTRQRARATGAMKTWKRAPESFRLPIKRGLREYGAITEMNMDDWELM